MESNKCFFSDCMLDVEYTCPCTSPNVYSCKLHVINHLENRSSTHAMNFIFIEFCDDTKHAILNFLEKLNSKNKKLKSKILASFNHHLFDSENELKNLLKEIDFYSDELKNCFAKISEAKKILISEQDPILNLLSLRPDEAVEKMKKIIPPNPDFYNSSKMFCRFNEKIEKMIECFIENKFQNYLENRLTNIENTLEEHNKSIILTNNELESINNSITNVINENNKNWRDFEEWKDKTNLKTESEINLINSQIYNITKDLTRIFKETEIAQRNIKKIMAPQDLKDKISELLKNFNNNPKLEEKYRKDCIAYENDFLAQNIPFMQEYQDYLSTYHHKSSLFNLMQKDNRTNLLIHNTETEAKQAIKLETPEPIGSGTCITQLPNGKLFCFGNYSPTRFSGLTLLIDENYSVELLPSGIKCHRSSAIYFNNNIYCFGGWGFFSWILNHSLPLSSRFDLNINQWIKLAPLPKSDYSCNSILFNENILISGYENTNLLEYSIEKNCFKAIPYKFAEKKRKILINSEKRLYLIESSNGGIFESEIESDTEWRRMGDSIIDSYYSQVYFQYNKGGIYIGCAHDDCASYFKFDLNDKELIKLD